LLLGYLSRGSRGSSTRRIMGSSMLPRRIMNESPTQNWSSNHLCILLSNARQGDTRGLAQSKLPRSRKERDVCWWWLIFILERAGTSFRTIDAPKQSQNHQFDSFD
jgi:hypothetical protein